MRLVLRMVWLVGIVCFWAVTAVMALSTFFGAVLQTGDREAAIWVEKRFSVGMAREDVLGRLGGPDSEEALSSSRFGPLGATRLLRYSRYGPRVHLYLNDKDQVVCVKYSAESAQWQGSEERR